MSRKEETESGAPNETQVFKDEVYRATIEYMERTMLSYNVSPNDPIWIVLRGISHVFAESSTQNRGQADELIRVIETGNQTHQKTVSEIMQKLETATKNSAKQIAQESTKLATRTQENAKELDSVIVQKLIPAVTKLEKTVNNTNKNFAHAKMMVLASGGLSILVLLLLVVQAWSN